jgi:hypothetical protein
VTGTTIFSGNTTIGGDLNVSGTTKLLTVQSGSTSDQVLVYNTSTNAVERKTDVTSSPWSAYTPVWTAASVNPVIGNGSITGSYYVIGKTCFVRVRVVMGSTTTYGTGAWYISLPVTAASAYGVIMPATMLNNGITWYSGLVNGGRLGNTSITEIQWQNTGGTADGISSSIPFVWGSTDEFEFNGSYEIQ